MAGKPPPVGAMKPALPGMRKSSAAKKSGDHGDETKRVRTVLMEDMAAQGL